MISQTEILLPEFSRGFHLVTEFIQAQLPPLTVNGLCNIFIKHTSAGLTINENADPSVRVDFESSLNHIVRENEPFYTHTFEGPDDMPAHIKSTLVGSSVTIPLTNGKFNLGTWQGVYLCEFRNRPQRRKLVVTIYG